MVATTEGKTHPTHYLMHKYWGRKAHNLIADHINYYTSPGERVLDPFMGSGGVVIESKKSGRHGIGVDINPITKLIVDNTINDVDVDIYQRCFKKIMDSIPEEVRDLSETQCPECGQPARLDNAVWIDGLIRRVKGTCPTHKQFVKDADRRDILRVKQASILLKKYEQTTELYYPKDRILDFVRRNGKKHINELFTDRNLLQSAVLLAYINKVSNNDVKKLLHMAFTSMLPNVSSMIPADESRVTGKSGWQISKFWVPGCHTEKNVFTSFTSRVRLIAKGKIETQGIFSRSPHNVYIRSAENLDFLDNNSVDYIFTDPPYGDSIAYLGLSMFWNAWLRYDVNYEAEIIYDTYRGKGNDDYSQRLTKVFEELYRVLRPGKHLSFTFNNRQIKFWQIIIDAVLVSGFSLEDIVWHPQAASSGTQGINRKNTLRGDFVYTFKKPPHEVKQTELIHHVPGEELLIKEVSALFQHYEFLETARIYEHVIPILVRQRAFLDCHGKLLNVDKTLKENFTFKEMPVGNKLAYGWARV